MKTIRFPWLTALLTLGTSLSIHADDTAPPDRRELWVPFDRIAKVLEEKAVLITREQYDTLLRDAGLDKPKLPEAPQGAVISQATYRARIEGSTVVIDAEFSLNVLRDGWVLVPLGFEGAVLGEVKLTGEAALIPSGECTVPNLLLLRGRGGHTVHCELTAPVQSGAGVSRLACGLPVAAVGNFALKLPPGFRFENSEQATKIVPAGASTIVTAALSPAQHSVAISWKSAQSGENAGRAPWVASASLVYTLAADYLGGVMLFGVRSVLGELPETIELNLPAPMKVLRVQAAGLRDWKVEGGNLVLQFPPGTRTEQQFQIEFEAPSLDREEQGTLVMPMPELRGVPRIETTFSLSANESVVVKEVTVDATAKRIAAESTREEPGFHGRWRSAKFPVVRVAMERAKPRLEADLDTRVAFESAAIMIERTVTLRVEKARRFTTDITLPPGEELLSVLGADGSEPEWRMEAGAVRLTWSDDSREARVFKLRSRVEPEQWTSLPAEGVTFVLGDAKIAGADKVTGYLALVADAAFRMEAVAGETLERRDGRSTPVRGEYAWFRRESFDLQVKVTRRPAEILAALTGYALPLEGVLDLHATMNYQFLHGGTRAVKLRVPAELAQNFQFEGPQIAERVLVGDVWTITFQKELTGDYALELTAQVPVPKQSGADPAKGYSFDVRVPVIAPLEVARSSGLWAVEANTETEITFEAKGLNELDSLLAPRLAGYQPRHRVIGVFGWLGADYALTLHGVRHTSAEVIGMVVDSLELDTATSTSGLHRHQAAFLLRTAGAQYLDITLPAGAGLLSLVVDGVVVKPVADEAGDVRVQMPAHREANTAVQVTLLYETPGGEWQRSGGLTLAAPKLAREIPILSSHWRVWVPEGFEYSAFASNLAVPKPAQPELLVSSLASFASSIPGSFLRSRKRSQATAILEDLRMIDAGIDMYAIEYNQSAGTQVNWGDVQRYMKQGTTLYNSRGVDYYGRAGESSKVGDAAFYDQAADADGWQNNAKGHYRLVPPSNRQVAADYPVPGMPLPAKKADSIGLGSRGSLTLDGSAEFAAPAEAAEPGKVNLPPAPPAPPASPSFAALSDVAPAEFWNPSDGRVAGRARLTGSLLPVLLDLPRNGQALVFDGLYAAEQVSLHYEDWWSRARRLWLWFVGGGIVFYLVARGRPWWRTLWAVLLLSAVPLCVSITCTPVCNALLGGWLAGLVLNRIAARCVFRVTKEVLA